MNQLITMFISQTETATPSAIPQLPANPDANNLVEFIPLVMDAFGTLGVWGGLVFSLIAVAVALRIPMVRAWIDQSPVPWLDELFGFMATSLGAFFGAVTFSGADVGAAIGVAVTAGIGGGTFMALINAITKARSQTNQE